jgi:enoyl-CoA hydratase
VLAGRDLPLEQALEVEAAHFGRAAESSDWKEGTRAFLEKRKAEFKGR